MAYVLQQLANAMPVAALYAALAFGYSIAFGMTRRADIVFGALFAFSGQIYLLFTAIGWNALVLILPAALAFGAAVSVAYTLIAGYWVGRSVMLPQPAGWRWTERGFGCLASSISGSFSGASMASRSA
jgi:Branched-chain amino acid ABC-type transport system, permease components